MFYHKFYLYETPYRMHIKSTNNNTSLTVSKPRYQMVTVKSPIFTVHSLLRYNGEPHWLVCIVSNNKYMKKY